MRLEGLDMREDGKDQIREETELIRFEMKQEGLDMK